MENLEKKICGLFDFSRSLSFREKVKHVGVIVAAMSLWAFLILLMYSLAGIYPQETGELFFYGEEMIWWKLLFAAVVAVPLIEEGLFRFLPIRLTQTIFRSRKTMLGVALCVVICVSSVLFGYLHGGLLFIPIQGVYGLLLSWLFLKNNNSFISIWIAHVALNVIIIGATLAEIFIVYEAFKPVFSFGGL